VVLPDPTAGLIADLPQLPPGSTRRQGALVRIAMLFAQRKRSTCSKESNDSNESNEGNESNKSNESSSSN